MFQLIESIKVINGKPENILRHEQRMNFARHVLNGCTDPIDLSEALSVPAGLDKSLYKCRVVYSTDIELVEFIPYTERSITTLRKVFCDWIDYSFKYLDRTAIDILMKEKGDSDDILIIRKGFVTDTSYCNILFYTGNQWVTPDRPLLEGTKRAALIEKGLVVPRPVREPDIAGFSSFMLVNALLDFDLSRALDISRISG
jgi:4-amino-4-deoxychorismate lyase